MITERATASRGWDIDPSHSSVAFTVTHLMISKVRGSFREYSGRLVVPVRGRLPVSIEVSITASSIDTHDNQRDAHLRSADFLDVERYPIISFKSTSAAETLDRQAGRRDFTIDGVLTMHGVSRNVVLSGTFQGTAFDMFEVERISYEAHCSVSRKDFGLTWNQNLGTGGILVGDIVDISLDIQAIAEQLNDSEEPDAN